MLELQNFSEEECAELPNLLSQARFGRYLQAAGQDVNQALKLYQWNLELSGELLKVMHACEIGLRNAVAEAIAAIHGENWPWVQGFRVSLQDPKRGYSPRKDLAKVAEREPTTGKVIAELRFAFWERMLNASHHNRIWKTQLPLVFPHMDFSSGANVARDQLRQQVFVVRDLRNRIAHHEPIFDRSNLKQDVETIMAIIQARCLISASWVERVHSVPALLEARP